MTPNPLANHAILALRQGDLQAAERWAHEAFRATPQDPLSLLAYGAVMNARGSHQNAAKAFRKLTRLQPGDASNWMNLATAERAAGNIESAGEAYERAATLGGWTVELLYNSALLELERGQFTLARERLKQAAQQKPVDAEVGYRYAQLCISCAETDEAMLALARWRHWQNWTPDLLASTGSLLLTLGVTADTGAILAELEGLQAATLDVELNVIGMLERTNDLQGATQRLDALKQRNPTVPEDQQRRWQAIQAQLASRNGQLQDAVTFYRQILAGDVPLPERQDFLYPLAKVLDADRQFDAAIAAADLAHASHMAFVDLSSPLSPEEMAQSLRITDFSCEAADIALWREDMAPTPADSPVFIVAFPRSGTTLLEQMLDAHPGLQTMDEQPFLQEALARLQQQGVVYPERLAEAEPHQLAEARRHYWARVRSKVTLAPGQRLLDKNPLNMLRLPIIQRLFPNAPILLAIRHPFDVIISNYFQHFRAPEFARLCRDLPTLAAGYRRSFDFWYQQAELLKPNVREVFYEAFVSDFENQSRSIAAFAGLDWHEAMREPATHARSKGYISTPSYSQVIQPVNRKAVGRWKRYEAQLLPLHDEVAHLMARWGYEL